MPRWPKTRSLTIAAAVMVGLLATAVLFLRPLEPIADKSTVGASENQPRENISVRPSESSRIPKSNAEAYAALRGQSAICLVALSRATGDPSWLQRAIAEHPEDPRVQLERWRTAKTPEEALAAARALRQAAPSNPLGAYLEAGQSFEQRDLGAVARLMTDVEETGSFNSYTLDIMLETQAAFSASGLGEREAWEAAYNSDGGLLPKTLEVLSRLGDNMGELQHVFVGLGYWDDADFMFERTLALGEQLEDGDTFFENLVGIALQKKLLSSFDAQTLVSDDGKRVSQRLAELDAVKEDIRATNASVTDEKIKSLDAAGWAQYHEILRLDGEIAAFRWLSQRK